MKICLFIISDGWGGAENVAYNLAKYLTKKDHHVSIILNEETHKYFKNLKNVDLYNIGHFFNYHEILKNNYNINLPDFFVTKRGISQIFIICLGPLLKKINYYRKKEEVLHIINSINPDVINFHNPIVLEFYSHLYKDLKYPKIYTGHVKDYVTPFLKIPILKKMKLKKIMHSFNHITAVSKYVKEVLLSLNFHPKKEIKIIYNGFSIIDTQHIKKKKLPHDFNIAFMGGIKSTKGGDIAIKAMEKLKEHDLDVHLYITKQIPKDHYYRKLSHTLDLEDRITFLGFLDKKDYFSFFKSIDAIVMPTETEGFPMLYLEAMIFGIPIITTPYGGSKELIKDRRNGLYINRNPEKIAEKILYLAKNHQSRKEIAENNMKDVKKFDWNKIVDQYIDLYQLISK